MRGVVAFLVWLFSFWTWFPAFFRLRWFKTPPLDDARLDTSDPGEKQFPSPEGQHESPLATFLSSFPASDEVHRLHHVFDENGFRLCNYNPRYGQVSVYKDIAREFSGDGAAYREFLAAVASSEVVCPARSFGIRLKGDDSLEHLEEIVGALLSNNNIEGVTIFCSNCSRLQMAECVSKLLLGNRVIQYLSLELDSQQVVGKEAAEQLAIALNKNRVLKTLALRNRLGGVGVDDEGLEALVKPLKSPHSALRCLLINVMSDVGLEHVGVMLCTNTSLKELCSWDLNRTDGSRRDEVYMRGYSSLRDALCINRSLQKLYCTVGNSMELKMLLEPLMPVNNNPQANTTLTSLELYRSRIGGKEGVDVLVDMIRTNTSLLKLYLYKVQELREDDAAVENTLSILEALKVNKSLKTMGFDGCDGVGGYQVLGTMMDLLLENHHLEDIDLSGTPLERSGDAEYVYSELKKRKKMKLWDLIQGMANVSPKSGRVFLCGDPYAGKTTLRKSMKKLPDFQNKQDSQNKRSSKLPLRSQGKRLYDRVFKEPKMSKVKMTNERTRGIEIDQVDCNGIGISIWDMAGQSDYHSFHDLVVPNLSADGSCSLFLVMCNPMVRGSSSQKRNISAIKSEIEYWLRFIASNTRRSWSYRPHVSIVMTHFDYWDNEKEFVVRIEDVIEELKSEFQEVLKFDPGRTMFKVDGEDVSYARTVFDFIKNHLEQLMERLPKTIKACAEVQQCVAAWNEEIAKQSHDMQVLTLPVLKWDDFSNIMFKGVEDMHNASRKVVEKKKEFVAISLNDGGHIMYHEEGGFVITNPHWFCHDIMGEFLHACANVDSKLEMVSKHGMISLDHVKRMLSKTIGSQGQDNLLDELLSMMKKLHICYEQDTNSIMIPSTLQDKCQQLVWPTTERLTSGNHVGRRLSCKDEKRTMLSLGFFSRLQVSFFKKFQNNNVGNSYQIFQDAIIFISDGIEVIIESNHTHIDILLRSDQCEDKILEFLEQGIVLHIRELLMNPTLGCAGVILVEHILRPRCVQELVDSTNRKDQFASMEELELEVITSGFDASHNWKPCGSLGTGYDKVKTLLGEKAWVKLLQRRYEDLKRYQREIFHKSSQRNLVKRKAEDSSWTSLVLQIPHKLFAQIARNQPNALLKEMDHKLDTINRKIDVVIQKVDSVLQMQESIVEMQDDLLHEVSSRMDALMAFSVRMQQSQVPKLAYLTEIGKGKLLMRLVPGVTEFQLYLMCESRDGVHIVANQQGCKVTFGTNETKIFLSVLVWGLKIATILTKVGAHVAGGMGGMVPNFGEGLQFGGLILDTPSLLDQVSNASLEAVPNGMKKRPKITIDDESKAQEWLTGFLEPKCKEKSTFYNVFRLKKVVYKGTSRNQSTAWVCEKCIKDGIQSGKLYDDYDT